MNLTLSLARVISTCLDNLALCKGILAPVIMWTLRPCAPVPLQVRGPSGTPQGGTLLYGAGKEHSAEWWKALLGMLLERGLVAMVSKQGGHGSYSSITLTSQVPRNPAQAGHLLSVRPHCTNCHSACQPCPASAAHPRDDVLGHLHAATGSRDLPHGIDQQTDNSGSDHVR